MSNIHETAIIYDGAEIAEDVIIGPYSIIGPQVKIGKGTIVESHVVIDGETVIGENNKIFSFASVGKESQDLKYKGEATRTIIGNNNKIREFVTIHRGTTQNWETKIGDNNLIMAYVHVAHDCIIGNGCILANNATLAGHVIMEDFSYVGGLTPVHQFCKIGTHAFVGGASSINQDIVPFCLAEGAKGGPRAINAIGLKRKGYSDETLRNLKETFKIIFRSKMRLEEAVAKVKEEYGNDDNVKIMLDFIAKSDRGIAR
ncbi:MAG: acyl-ACP--UDP-N-acetylglucosamine O-acyltransferase [Fusobacteriaceae bacterium]|nr:acyl-ACP--UDP-N-acetylglucosamine O-acyltransferase [Fusobacteriaceae bacterium]MBN2838846.1 acyl-ACP--UDP-N-acetylglucosamine O-acyltransferase [Fusobacteriaceae bacterium]